MAHEKVYVTCEDRCFVEGMTKAQTIDLINSGFIDQNSGEKYKFWIGTVNEFNKITQVNPHIIYIKTNAPQVEHAVLADKINLKVTGSAENDPITKEGCYLLVSEKGSPFGPLWISKAQINSKDNVIFTESNVTSYGPKYDLDTTDPNDVYMSASSKVLMLEARTKRLVCLYTCMGRPNHPEDVLVNERTELVGYTFWMITGED